MFTFKLDEFSTKNYTLSFEFENYKIVTGSFINEDSIISEYFKNKKYDEMDIDSTNISQNSFNTFSSETKTLKIFSKLEEIHQLLFSPDTFYIITNLQELLILPLLIKKFNLLNLKVISTEPLIQIGKYYMKDFYSSFNKLILELSNPSDSSISNSNIENKHNIEYSTLPYINESEIDAFTEKVEKMHFNEKFDIAPHLKVVLVSSSYELGSSNLIINYFDKKISVMSKWSNYKYRYPKEFDLNALIESDVLIILPETINYSTDCESSLAHLTSEINKISSKISTDSTHYPNIFLPTEWSFLLDFVDLMRYKIPKENKNIYISNSIKAVLEYSNVSHGFINATIHNKIYEFKLPFSFDELFKHEQLYLFKNFEDFLKNFLFDKSSNFNNLSNSPVVYLVPKLSYLFGEAQTIFENFVNNSNSSDALIHLNKCLFDTKNSLNNKFKVVNINLDTRGTLEQFRSILECAKPNKFFYFDEEAKNLDFVKFVANRKNSNDEFYQISKNKFVSFENEIFYDKVYFNAKDKNEFDNFLRKFQKKLEIESSGNELVKQNEENSNKYSIQIDRENDTLLVKLQPDLSILKTKKTPFEAFEEDLAGMLEVNKMKINEFLCKENSIKISIVRNNESDGDQNKFYSDVIIKLDGEPSIDVNCEAVEDSEFLNKLFVALFS